MKRHLMTLALGALVGSFVLVNSAEACHKRKAVCAEPTPVCAPAPVYVAAPVCEPAPVCAPVAKKKHGFKNPLKGMKLGHGHKKAAACAPAPVAYEQVVTYAPAPVYAAPQASPQATPQAAPQAPAKATPQG